MKISYENTGKEAVKSAWRIGEIYLKEAMLALNWEIRWSYHNSGSYYYWEEGGGRKVLFTECSTMLEFFNFLGKNKSFCFIVLIWLIA